MHKTMIGALALSTLTLAACGVSQSADEEYVAGNTYAEEQMASSETSSAIEADYQGENSWDKSRISRAEEIAGYVKTSLGPCESLGSECESF